MPPTELFLVANSFIRKEKSIFFRQRPRQIPKLSPSSFRWLTVSLGSRKSLTIQRSGALIPVENQGCVLLKYPPLARDAFRKIFDDAVNHCHPAVIVGPYQCGKTTLLLHISRELQSLTHPGSTRRPSPPTRSWMTLYAGSPGGKPPRKTSWDKNMEETGPGQQLYM